MCVICVLFEQEKLTAIEANNAVMETLRTTDQTDEEITHLVEELLPKILRKTDYDFSKIYPKDSLESADNDDDVVIKGEE